MTEELPTSNCDEVVVVARLTTGELDHRISVGVIKLSFESRGQDSAELRGREPRPIGSARVQDRPVLVEVNTVFWPFILAP